MRLPGTPAPPRGWWATPTKSRTLSGQRLSAAELAQLRGRHSFSRSLTGMISAMDEGTEGTAFGDVAVRVDADLVATAEIRRPPDNFFDAELISSLADAYGWAEQAGARAIMLCSEGKHFCAGADFSGRSTASRVDGSGGARLLYNEAIRLFEAPLPVIA